MRTGFNPTPGYDHGKGRPRLPYPVPSGPVLDLRAFNGLLVHVSGTGTITQVLPPPNGECYVVFDAACTLTYNATSLILPGAANITTAAGDTAIACEDTPGNARFIDFAKASGQAVAVTTPGLTLISTTDVSGTVATIDFLSSFSSTYDNYLVICEKMQVNIADRPLLRLATGGAVDTGANYNWSGVGGRNTAAAQSNGGQTSMALTSANDLDAATAFSMIFEFVGMNGGSSKQVFTRINGMSTTIANWAYINLQYANNTVVTGFRLLLNGANSYSAGTIKIYGYKN